MKTTDYKGKPRRELPSVASRPDELNAFYACFEARNTETCRNAPAVPDNLTSVAMECFEMMLMAQFNTIMPDTLDPL